MLSGELLFVETNRIVGESAKGPYDFTNLIVSDGFKSVELNMDDNLLANPIMGKLSKGQKILLTVDYKRNRLTATDIKSLS